MSVIHLVDVIRQHPVARPLPRPSVDPSLPILALPPGRSERSVRVLPNGEVPAADDRDPRPVEHTLPSGHPIFAQWLRCRAARAGY